MPPGPSCPRALPCLLTCSTIRPVGAWRSLVAHLLWERTRSLAMSRPACVSACLPLFDQARSRENLTVTVTLSVTRARL
jgi:hypothetical protein